MWIEKEDFEHTRCNMCGKIIVDAQDKYDHASRYGVTGYPGRPHVPRKRPSIIWRGKLICLDCLNSNLCSITADMSLSNNKRKQI